MYRTGTRVHTRRQSGWLGEQICTNAFWIFGAHNDRYNGIYQVVESHWCNGKPIYQAYDDTEGAGNKFGPVLYQPTGAFPYKYHMYTYLGTCTIL